MLPIALHSLHYNTTVIVLVVSLYFIMKFIHTCTFTNIIRPPGSFPPAVPLMKQRIKLLWPNHQRSGFTQEVCVLLHWQRNDKPSDVIYCVWLLEIPNNYFSSVEKTGCCRVGSSTSQNLQRKSSALVVAWQQVSKPCWCLLLTAPLSSYPKWVLSAIGDPWGPNRWPWSTTLPNISVPTWRSKMIAPGVLKSGSASSSLVICFHLSLKGVGLTANWR